MTNIVALSDSHNMHHDKRLGMNSAFISNQDNILIHAGDHGVRGSMGEVHLFADWIDLYYHYFKAVIFIAGNHDKEFEDHPAIARNYFKHMPNVYYLEDSGCEIEGIKFWGCPHTIEYHGGFNMSKEKLVDHHETIPEDTDVLITHSPPYGIMDIDKTEHLGSQSLLERVKKIKPKIHIFGHIHPGSGTFETKDTMFVNAAVVAPHSYNVTHSVKYIPLNEDR